MRPIPGTVTDPAALARAFPSTGPSEAQLYELADALATVAHAGQTRKGNGEPYVNHVRRVASRVHSTREKIIALLHDVVEDTDVTAEMLRALGFPEDIVSDVIALTRGYFREEETYWGFIGRTILSASDNGLRVKLADLKDNLSDLDRTPELKGLDRRYRPAYDAIRDELTRRKPR